MFFVMQDNDRDKCNLYIGNINQGVVYMSKRIIFALVIMLLLSTGQVFAGLADNRASITAAYGEYRLVVDSDGQLWTKSEWETGGYLKAKASAYVYYFTRGDVKFQMEVQYDNSRPEALVKAQRFTPDVAVKIKDLNSYLPEVYSAVTVPEAVAFASEQQLTRNFRDETSPVTLGVAVKKPTSPGRNDLYSLYAFNVKDEGRLIKSAKFIGKETYIHELVIERVHRQDVNNPQDADRDWEWINNPFK